VKDVLQYATALASFGSLVLWFLTYSRAGAWREGEDAKALIKRVDECEDRLTKVEGRLDHVATKADVAAIAAEIKAIERNVESVAKGVGRIEGHLMGARA
jgi:hypothetical protein